MFGVKINQFFFPISSDEINTGSQEDLIIENVRKNKYLLASKIRELAMNETNIKASHFFKRNN